MRATSNAPSDRKVSTGSVKASSIAATPRRSGSVPESDRMMFLADKTHHLCTEIAWRGRTRRTGVGDDGIAADANGIGDQEQALGAGRSIAGHFHVLIGHVDRPAQVQRRIAVDATVLACDGCRLVLEDQHAATIGRASVRERVCQYV